MDPVTAGTEAVSTPRAWPPVTATLAGSLPKPAWLAAPGVLWPPWRLPPETLAEGIRDAVRLAVSADLATERANTVAEAIFLARDLINTPAADLGPAELSDAAAAVALAPGIYQVCPPSLMPAPRAPFSRP